MRGFSSVNAVLSMPIPVVAKKEPPLLQYEKAAAPVAFWRALYGLTRLSSSAAGFPPGVIEKTCRIHPIPR